MPRVQQAYVYVTCAVAIHMAVLGLANVLRVLLELATGTPSAAFLGLPFLFAEGSLAPRSIHREQISLALALLLIGAPAWYFHWRAARRAAERSEADRNSPVRSGYLHLVTFVTALLVFFHGQFALDALLREWISVPLFPGEPPRTDTASRVMGAASMIVAAGATWWYHARAAGEDRRRAAIRGEAAGIRRVHAYLLAAIGVFVVLFAASQLLDALWRVAFASASTAPAEPFGFRPPTAGEQLRLAAVSTAPALVLGPVLWLVHWRPAQRLVAGAHAEAAEERRSAVRRLALYVVALLAAMMVLFQLTFGLVGVVRQLLGDPDPAGGGRSLLEAAGGQLAPIAVFALAWVFHRRVIAADAARQPELEKQADMRRLYYYPIAALTLGMLAVGTAGLVGVVGSYAMGYQTHDTFEIATYVALVAVGLPFWAFHWYQNERYVWSADAGVSLSERRARGRRAFLFLAIGGGGLVVLVAGAATLFRVLNAALAQDFGTAVVHDIWHLLVDTAVGAAVVFWHWRVLRADRRALAAAGPEPRARTVRFLVTMETDDAAAARAGLELALAGAGRVEEVAR